MTDKRPWGSFQIFESKKDYWIKKITVKPGKKLSLQYHKHREEDWVIVKGTGIITRQTTREEVRAGNHYHIPCFVLHRIENTGTSDLVFLELARGTPKESDIIRVEDDYGRA